MGKNINFGSTSKKRVLFGKQKFSLSKPRRIHWQHPYSICQDKGFIVVVVFPFWCLMGVIFFGLRNPLKMA